MQVAVTGGAGFIGANLVRSLLSAETVRRVIVVDDFSTGRPENLAGLLDRRLEVVKGSILESEVLDAAFHDVDAIVHLAALPSVPRSIAAPMATHTVNTTGTVEVLEAARRAGDPHIVVASSSSVYGDGAVLPKREDLAVKPLSPYAASKLATEAYAAAYGASFGLSVLAFRFFNVYGPFQPADHAYAAVIPNFVAAALEGRPVIIHGDGRQSRDFTYVGTAAEVIVQAVLNRVTHPTPVNLAFGTRHSLLEVVDLIEEVLGISVDIEYTDPRLGDVPHSQADHALLDTLVPMVRPTDLIVGLTQTIEWFRAASPSPSSEAGSYHDAEPTT